MYRLDGQGAENEICLLIPVFYFYPLALMPGLLQWSTTIELRTRKKFEKFSIRPFLILAPDISARDISVWTFHHRDFSAQGHFSTKSFRMGIFPHHGHIDTWTFWHRGTRAEMSMTKCLYCFARSQNVNVSKHSSPKMSQCCNLPVLKCPWCHNISMLKCPHAK